MKLQLMIVVGLVLTVSILLNAVQFYRGRSNAELLNTCVDSLTVSSENVKKFGESQDKWISSVADCSTKLENEIKLCEVFREDTRQSMSTYLSTIGKLNGEMTGLRKSVIDAESDPGCSSVLNMKLCDAVIEGAD